jgi:superfamily II DNA or RNA helicase
MPHYLQDTISRRGVLLSALAKNNKRSAIIAKFAGQLVDSGRQTLVVSERIPHLEQIHQYMVQMGIPESDLGFYLGKTSKRERARVAKECSCILATMSMLSLGTDIPTLRGLVFATPVSQIAQPVGRIRRISPELKDPFVVDFYDSDYDECTRWMRNRRRFYESIGCQINYIDS